METPRSFLKFILEWDASIHPRFSQQNPSHSEQVSNPQEQRIVATFQQDKDALEAIAALQKNDPRKFFAEASFASGRPGLEKRRLLQLAALIPAGDININQGHTA